jgi:hypothetical protein
MITEELVFSELSNVKSNKSPGVDGIPSILLKELKCNIVKPLTYLFRMSHDTGQIPSDWKDAIVTPLF